jgi:hypothetical protein
MTTDTEDKPKTAAALSAPVPIMVGIAGKRKERLAALDIAETQVRDKLRHTFDLLEALTPHSPKLLLCGMADGVDEIAVKLVLDGSDKPGQRKFYNWSVVGLLPLPEAAFIDDFSGHGGWWYRALDPAARDLIRLMPLATLAKAPLTAADGPLAAARYTAEDLRAHRDQTDSVRTAHYEQLGLVLAERSTILIAVMPEGETPKALGGTAQVVAHRLNGWRPEWPPADAAAIAAASQEYVVPPELAASGCGDVWLVPIGASDGVDLKVVRHRQETERPWPEVLDGGCHHPSPHAKGALGHAAASSKELLRRRLHRAEHDVLIRDGQPFRHRALSSSPVFRIVEAYNRRALMVGPWSPPQWDRTIAAHPDDPHQWSQIAAAEHLSRTLSDVQVVHKKKVRNTVAFLGLFAWLSILVLEIYLEQLHGKSAASAAYMPIVYIAIVGAIIALLAVARRHLWAPIAEDYRMVAEALRVQIAWWHFGLVARRDRVDQRALRYDTGEFQLLRQSMATVLDAIDFSHAPLAAVPPGQRLPPEVDDWIGVAAPQPTGQIEYQLRTADRRHTLTDRFEFYIWSCFGLALGMAAWLALHALDDVTHLELFERIASALRGTVFAWLLPALLIGGFVVWVVIVAFERFEGKAEGVTFRRMVHSLGPGLLAAAAAVTIWHLSRGDQILLFKSLGTATLIMLATAGAIKYVAEKISLEAEAQNAAEASIIYSRARRALDQIDRDLDAKRIDLDEAHRRRTRLVVDVGQYALAETESWLRSHRERPMHAPVG